MFDIIIGYVIAFVIGGLICVIGQLILDLTTLTAGQILVIFTIVGAVLSGLGIYEPFLNFVGAGALIPVTGFGHSMTSGALMEVESKGLVGLFTGAFEFTGLGLICAVVFGSLIALIADPKV